MQSEYEYITFFNRARGTVFEGHYEILFNMLLVKMNLRPAFLLELFSNDLKPLDLKPSSILYKLEAFYPEFLYTTEYEIDGIPHRVFIHIDPLTEKDDDIIFLYNDWLGENLGYHCTYPGIKEDYMIITYDLKIGDKKFNLYAEMCAKDDFNETHFSEKLYEFNSIASKLGWEVIMSIKEKVGNEADYYIDLILKDELKMEHMSSLLEFLGGFGLISIDLNIDKGNYTLIDVFNAKKILLFNLLQTKIDPFSLFYPLSTSVYDEWTTEREILYRNLDTDPREIYNNFENAPSVKRVREKDPEEYQSIKDKLFDTYSELSLTLEKKNSQKGGRARKKYNAIKKKFCKECIKKYYCADCNTIHLPHEFKR